jgi:hypothetical protein
MQKSLPNTVDAFVSFQDTIVSNAMCVSEKFDLQIQRIMTRKET